MVSMIPFGLLAGCVGEKEVRITELDDTGFCFRLGKAQTEKMQFSGLKVSFYDIEYGKYNEVEIREFEIQKLEEEYSDFFVKYKVAVKQENYVQAVQRLLCQYNRYIHLKLEDDDSLLTKCMTGYAGNLDEVKYKSLEEQVGIWQREIDAGTEKEREKASLEKMENKPTRWEFCLALDRPELYRSYLDKPLAVFLQESAKRSIGTCRGLIRKRILSGEMPDRLYIGNQFCHLLFPDREILFRMMEKALYERIGITIAFTYVREYMLDSVKNLLSQINDWCEEKNCTVEVIVNDWGMAGAFGLKNLRPCLGILLNKRKKDPRISYKKGDQKLFEMNNLNADFYRNHLANEFRIQRFEWESCGYEQQFPEGKNSLHIPLYQTNTSQYCPLRAICINGERGRQNLAKECPQYCAEYALLYPEDLHMVGRYNSLFGIDMDMLKRHEKLEKCLENGVDRVVVSLL